MNILLVFQQLRRTICAEGKSNHAQIVYCSARSRRGLRSFTRFADPQSAGWSTVHSGQTLSGWSYPVTNPKRVTL